VFILVKGFLNSIDNDSSKRQIIKLPTALTNNTGKFSMKVITNKTNYFVELLNDNDKVIETVKDKKEFDFDKLPAGNYKFRVYIDENKNGKWDTGNIYNRQEPENTFFYKQKDGKYTVPLRENWTVGPITLIF
jgi:flagellar hook assembly protein FlgD